MNKFRFMIFFVALCVATLVNAQPKPEVKAKKFADEMTKVLQLNKEESQAIYDIQLARFKENQEIEKNYADDPETKKEKLKELGNRVFNETKKILGEDRQKKWKEYKSN